MPNIIDLTGKKFGRLIVEKIDYRKNSRYYWKCKCSCGGYTSTTSSELKSGKTKSCGCLQKEFAKKLHWIHGMTGTRFYRIWKGMRARCNNNKQHYYKNYGGRGIKICDSWINFITFYEDMFQSYTNHCNLFGEHNTSIDRKDVNGNYEPNNCKWSTRKEQGENKRIRKKEKQCLYCSKVMLIKPSLLNKKFYCNVECMAKDYKKRMSGDNNPNRAKKLLKTKTKVYAKQSSS